jgi:hypothetical protein
LTYKVNNSFIGTFPPKGIILYSYFAKLQLNSFAIRGVTLSHARGEPSASSVPTHMNPPPFQSIGQRENSANSTGTSTPTSHRLSTERKEFANTAISAAASILTFVLEEDDMRRALVGTPLYVHTMIAYASAFLMKVTTNWNTIIGLNVETSYVTSLLERMIHLLKGTVTSDRHLLYHIAAGIEKMLERSRQAIARGPPAIAGGATTSSNVNASTNGWVPSSASEVARARASSTTSVPYSEQPFTSSLPETSGPTNGSGSIPANIDLNGFQGPWNNNYNIPSGMEGQGTETPGTEYGGFLGNNMMIMNDSLIYEAFGSESSNDVYNLLSSQFSY